MPHSLFKTAIVEMMGLIGMGNNPMVGCTVATAVAVEEGMNKSGYYWLCEVIDKIKVIKNK